jgi:hypothetical protein
MRAGRTFPRWLPLCAALLTLVQLAGVVHLAAAPHGVCWEHGVVVDLDAASRGGEPVAAPVGLSPATGPHIRSDQHPHCPALWVLRQARLEVPGSAPVGGSSPHLPVAGAPGQLVSPPDGWALRCAPKHSPPV